MLVAAHAAAMNSPNAPGVHRYPLQDDSASKSRRRGHGNAVPVDRDARGKGKGDDVPKQKLHWCYYFSSVLLLFVGVLMIAHAIQALLAYNRMPSRQPTPVPGTQWHPGTQIWINPAPIPEAKSGATPLSLPKDPRVAENELRHPLREVPGKKVSPEYVTLVIPVRADQLPLFFLRRLAVTYLKRLEVIFVAVDRFTPDSFREGIGSLPTTPLFDTRESKFGGDETWKVGPVKTVHPAFLNARLIRVARSSEDGGIYPGISELIMIGADASDPSAGTLVFLSPTHVPEHPLFLDRLVASLLETQPVRGMKPAAVQCAVLQATDRMDQQRDGALVVVDHGFSVEIGSARSQPAVFISRRVAGFGARDERLSRVELVDAVAPHCLAINKHDLYVAGGLTSSGPSGIDLAISGKLDGGAIENSLELLRVRVLRVEKAMESISLAEVHSAGNGLRQIVREAYAEVVDASALWEELTGKVFDTELSKKPAPMAAAADDKAVATVKNEPIETRLKFFTRCLVDQVAVAKKLGRSRDSSHVEEQIGWDLSMRLRVNGGSVWVSNVTAIMRLDLLPNELQGAVSATRAAHNQASFALSGEFGNRWSNFARALHPAFSSTAEPVVRIVWYSICCGCCGFSSEIVHFVTPLQRRFYVSVLLGPKCFCDGYPTAVSDGLSRMHITGEQYVLQRTSRDEILIWISHTDPLSFNNDIFNRRRPDYIVGRSMYEFSRIGDNWVAHANKYADEVWVPAQFVYDLFEHSGVDRRKLVIIPEGIDTNFYHPDAHGKLDLPLDDEHRGRWVHHCNKPPPPGAFKFFSNFKWEPRKGWEILFEAYELQFGSSKKAREWRARNPPLSGPGRSGAGSERPVSLYILSYLFIIGNGNTHNVSKAIRDLDDFVASRFPDLGSAAGLPHFCVITDSVSEVELAQMYNAMDAFVLPTRGEGWGLPTIQSMAMAKPVISTHYGGQLEFMTNSTSFLIELDGVEEVPSDSIYGFQDGKKWGTPSTDHTAQLMRYVIEHPDHAASVGRRARRHIETYFSEEAVAKTVDARVQEIKAKVLQRRKFGTDPHV